MDALQIYTQKQLKWNHQWRRNNGMTRCPLHEQNIMELLPPILDKFFHDIIEKLNKSIHAVHEVMRERAKKIFPSQQLHGKAKPGGRSSCTKPCTFFTEKYKADTNNQMERINWPFNKWSIHKMVILITIDELSTIASQTDWR